MLKSPRKWSVAVLLPRSLDEVCAQLAAHEGAELLGGGTDLMVAVNAGRHPVRTVIALDRVAELATWRHEGDDLLLGAGLTYRQLLEPELAALAPALAQAARTVGSPQIRNAGTLGGNLATASPAGDTLPVLAALDATIVACSARGRREIAFADFCVAPKQTSLEPDELIEGVRIPAAAGPQEFLKVGTRNAMVIAVASVAVVVDRPGRSMRVGLGSVGPTPLRAPEAEAFVDGAVDWDRFTIADPAVPARFGALVSEAARPIDDHRSTADYRRHCVGVLARRAVTRIFAP
jgi:CO/xanthine dehydrogenase FAD-binding subunit